MSAQDPLRAALIQWLHDHHDDMDCTRIADGLIEAFPSLTIPPRQDEPGLREALGEIVEDWIGEGFTTPPYSAVQYDIFEWLGVTSEQYDVTRSAVPVVGRAAPSAEPPETD